MHKTALKRRFILFPHRVRAPGAYDDRAGVTPAAEVLVRWAVEILIA